MRKALLFAAAMGIAFSPKARAQSSPYQCPIKPIELHAAFFDRNRDGVVTYFETLESLKKVGVGLVERQTFAAILHGAALLRTGSNDIPVVGIAKFGRHEGDTGVYTANGDLDEAAFNRLFDRFDSNPKSGALNGDEIDALIAANRLERGTQNAEAAAFELPFLLKHFADKAENGKPALGRERLRKFYNGTLLYELAGETPPCAPAQLLPR